MHPAAAPVSSSRCPAPAPPAVPLPVPGAPLNQLNQVAPDARFVIRHLSETRGAGRNRLFELFPYGYVGQACKLAGMKRPRAWSTG